MLLLYSGAPFMRIAYAQKVDDIVKLMLIINHGGYKQLQVRQVILQTSWFFTNFYP